jgi:hypothetical protein
MLVYKWILPRAFWPTACMLTLENQLQTFAVIPQLTNNPSLPPHITVALFLQSSLTVVNAYLKLSVQKSVETEFSNSKCR